MHLKTIGGIGNQLFQYAYAKAFCVSTGQELTTENWIGRRLFDLSERVQDGSSDFHGYRQAQSDLIYTRKQVREWLRFRPEVIEHCNQLIPSDDSILAHVRHGDYIGHGFPMVSRCSYLKACAEFGLDGVRLRFVSNEEGETLTSKWLNDNGIHFAADFIRLFHAKILLRANSTFSWWAAVLGSSERVFSPVMDGLPGGREHEVDFVEGNHPKFLEGLPFVTDLYLSE